MAAVAQVETETRTGVFPPGLTHVAFAAYRPSAPGIGLLPSADRRALAGEALRVLATARGVALRGTYDTSGYRSDAHVLVWLAAAAPDPLQDALAAFRRTSAGAALEPFWMAIGMHRPAERTATNAPAYFRGESARRYLCVHPLAYTVDWYLLEPHLRRRMLTDDHRLAREYPEVRTNAVSAFGMGDHEWLLADESDELVKLVELQRRLRSAELRRYVQTDLPIITGVRKPLAQILEALP